MRFPSSFFISSFSDCVLTCYCFQIYFLLQSETLDPGEWRFKHFVEVVGVSFPTHFVEYEFGNRNDFQRNVTHKGAILRSEVCLNNTQYLFLAKVKSKTILMKLMICCSTLHYVMEMSSLIRALSINAPFQYLIKLHLPISAHCNLEIS